MSEQVHGLQYDPFGLGSILRSFRLRVPSNQREYSWTRDQVNDLLQDFQRSIGVAGDQYFLGTVVTIPRGAEVLEVVDGQQRLATTTILLCAIRDYLKPRVGDTLIVEDLEKFLGAIDRDALERVPRLRLNVSDMSYFQERVYDGNADAPRKAPSHDLINEAAEICRAHVLNLVKTWDDKDHGKALNQWIGFIERRALVILLRVQSGANAYRMFETLNDRGLRTSQSDLVKNLIFGNAGDRLAEAEAKWASMRGVLEQSSDDEEILIAFLRHMLMVQGGFLRENAVYERVQERANGKTAALQLLNEFDRGARDYVAILFADHEKWNSYPPAARKAIAALNMLRSKSLRPLMLAMARSFDEEEATKGLRLLVDAWVRYMIVGGHRSGSTETRVASIAMQITEAKVANARALHAALAPIVPSDSVFVEQFKLASVSDRVFARYYLRSLERTAKTEPEPCFIPNDDQTQVNLEHVLPRHPGSNYHLFDAAQAKAYVNRIGNLALMQVSPNSDIGRESFETKRDAYRATSFNLTSQLADWSGDWSPKGVIDRQVVLAGLALKTWPFAVPPA